MKRIILIISLFICNLVADNDLSIYSAFKKAQELNRPIYYIVASDSCEHCLKHLKNTVIPNNEIIRKDFILAVADLNKGDKVPSDLPFDGYTPTTYIIAPNGSLMVSPLKGNFSQEYLYEILDKVYKAYGN